MSSVAVVDLLLWYHVTSGIAFVDLMLWYHVTLGIALADLLLWYHVTSDVAPCRLAPVVSCYVRRSPLSTFSCGIMLRQV
jgi:hypothetical protein